MGKLILNSLEIQNFRGFRHLQIERLGRVNLIVGKNNVGKSSLLEALRLYAQRGQPHLVKELLIARDEINQSHADGNTEIEEMLLSLKYIFYGRKDAKNNGDAIRIGPMGSVEEVLSITIGWYLEQFIKESGITRRQLLPSVFGVADDIVPRFDVRWGTQPEMHYSLAVSRLSGIEPEEIKSVFMPADGFPNIRLAILWDKVSLTAYERQVIAALQIITPATEGMSIIGDPASVRGRTPIIKVASIDEPLPLRSLGEGMQRMAGIALALVNARDGILLIDEVENGLHYTVQYELWQLIFQMASSLNIQVIATTHSWDCIEGFQKAAQENTQEEGLLIRLSVKNDEIAATVFDERKLAIATRQQIEVR